MGGTLKPSQFPKKCRKILQKNIEIKNSIWYYKNVLNIQILGEVNIMVKKRNIVLQIVLSLITCGIYGIYWFITLTDDAAKKAGDANFNGVKAFLFTLITCGIYGYYWYYKMGKTLKVAGDNNGVAVDDNSVLYLILGLFGLGIVNYCIMQNDLNKMADIEG